MKRRDFVQRLPTLTAGLAAAGTTVTTFGCVGTAYLVPRVAPGRLTFSSVELGEQGHAFIQTPSMERPIYVRRAPDGHLVAVLASCTHRGCQPEPLGDRLTCPCHGSEFTFEGAVLAGPAERPLDRYDVAEIAGDIVVHVEGGSR
jgi:cytochrome b6-f complex iron-sulfur subunit